MPLGDQQEKLPRDPRNLVRHRAALGHVGRVIATTFESLEVLRERYTEIDATIAELEKGFSEVYHAAEMQRVYVQEAFSSPFIA